MDEIYFDEWWKDFLHDSRYEKDGYLLIQDLVKYIKGLKETKKSSFLNDLLKIAGNGEEGWSFALRALREFPQQLVFDNVANQISNPPQTLNDNDKKTWMIYSMCVLAKNTDDKYLPLLTRYVENAKDYYWTSVLWVLWPHHQNLFANGWLRYFSTTPPEKWENTAIVQAFLNYPEAIQLLKIKMGKEYEGIWQSFRDALYAQLTNPWVKENRKRDIQKALTS